MGTTTLAAIVSTPIPELGAPAVDRISIVGHDRALQDVLSQIFSSEGYEVDVVPEGPVGRQMIRRRSLSALILVLRHPGPSGCNLYREIARSAPGVPFVILSANADIVERVLLLEMGADDYITIPFDSRELVARLRALIRRAARTSPDMFYVFEDVSVDFSRMEVTRHGEAVQLTRKEFKTLEFLTRNAHRVLSRDELLNKVWGYENYPRTRTVDNHILKLRQKLENKSSDPSHFLTIHGVGYKFVP